MLIQNAFDQCLDFPAALLLSEKPRLDDFRIVENHYVARIQKLRQIPERAIRERTSPVHGQEATRTPRIKWHLCDQFWGKMKIEIMELHIGHFSFSGSVDQIPRCSPWNSR